MDKVVLKRLAALSSLVACGSFSLPAAAEPIAYSIGLEERYTDNAKQVSSGEESDLESRVNFGINYNSDPGRCNGSIAAKLGYGRWLDDTYDPETYIDSDLLGDCQLANNLYWDVSNRTRDVVQDSRGGNNPDNTSRKNIFSTGPRYMMRLSPQDTLTLDARFESTNYDEPDETDSDRYVGTAAWNHLLSSTFSGGLSFQLDQSEMDTGQEIDRQTANVNFNKRWVSTVVSGSVGASKIESSFAGFSSDNNGMVWSLFLERELNSSSSITLSGSHQLTDQTSDYDIVFAGLVFNVQETEAIELTVVRAAYRNNLSNGDTFELGVSYDVTDYLSSGYQEDSYGIDASYNRKLTSRLRGHASGSFNSNSYSDDDTDDQTVTTSLGLQYDMSRSLSSRLTVGREERISDVTSREYVEHWIVLGVNYRFQ
ncbi:outer membrane beta-barrel protein [Marinobacter salinexigens]|uniref:Outer membrane beta-barrel protein n=1 Tax=Marinobacter salinexigens TaxID=2919747 RepID=A0A5B0VJZ1_9GAMM|nr:outer membrane beta-barrel protein [Marinobacter salinexigens]KAA1175040.1 outer membrane beta-barrel protein [Marinobacter salinexigens]